MQQGTYPPIKWAQRKDKVFITIDVVNVKDPKIDIVDKKTVKFSGSDANHHYSFELELYDEVNKEESKYTLESRNIFLNIKKVNKTSYWPRLTKATGKFAWINNDWQLYIDEDDEEEGDAKVPQFGNEQSK